MLQPLDHYATHHRQSLLLAKFSQMKTDLYKFTMWQTMLHRHPQTEAEYKPPPERHPFLPKSDFVCRNQPGYPL
jgi:nicotinate phosphoribosyltransferase